MSDADPRLAESIWIDEHAHLELTEFAQACGTSTAFIDELMREGVLQPRDPHAGSRFGAAEILRVRRVVRLQHAFDAPLPSVAVMLELLDEIERLRARLRNAGIAPD
jgi:chaperone modulatory protein CbpM